MPRKGTPSPRLDRSEFFKRFLSQFQDPSFRKLDDQLHSVAEAAWTAFEASRKTPVTSKAGNDFHEPNYELSVDWLDTRAAIARAKWDLTIKLDHQS